MVVLHYTGMATGRAAAERLCDPAAEVSAHYLIDTDGTVLSLVPEARRAWHAGQGGWGAVRDVNSHSIGIEIANPGHHLGYPPFPEAQMVAVEALVAAILDRWDIPPERVIGHACMAPGRKIDPGEKFDWRRLALQGLAVWLDPPTTDLPGAADAQRFAKAAARIGYRIDPPKDPGDWEDDATRAWCAAAMRFLREGPERTPHAAGIQHLEQIAKHWPVVDPAGSSA